MTELPPGICEKFAGRGKTIGELELSAKVSDSPPGLCLILSGSLDNNNSREFHELASEALASIEGGDSLILDLEALEYISSSGVGTLTTLLAEARRSGVFLFIRNMRDRVKAVFDVLGFSDFFSFI
jgi:anti-anti-sigma factor